MPTMIHEPARDIPVIAEADVAVLGGSATGVFAAVRAARLGASVVLIERTNRFGGVATNALVSVWHRLYDEVGKRRIIAGLTSEVIDRLDARNGVYRLPEANESVAFILNTPELAIEIDRLVLESRITAMLHTTFAAPIVKDGKLAGVAVENKSGRGAILARVFVDATGDGDLCARLGLATYAGPAPQPPTTCAHIAGWGDLGEMNTGKVIAEHREEYGLPPGFVWGAMVPGTDVRMVAGTRVANVDCADATGLTRAEMEGRRQVRAIVDLLNHHGAEGKLRLVALPSYIGIRETRHVRCRYRLTDGDVLHGRRFPDAIANGSYRIDVHHQDRPGITLRYLDGREDYGYAGKTETGRWRPVTAENPTFYQVPLGSLIPAGPYANLIVAGRMLDVEPMAFGAVRVMVNMNQTGEAAGVAAWHALETTGGIPAVDPERVRRTLAEGGSIIV